MRRVDEASLPHGRAEVYLDEAVVSLSEVQK